jgi:hypothetical protein
MYIRHSAIIIAILADYPAEGNSVKGYFIKELITLVIVISNYIRTYAIDS